MKRAIFPSSSSEIASVEKDGIMPVGFLAWCITAFSLISGRLTTTRNSRFGPWQFTQPLEIYRFLPSSRAGLRGSGVGDNCGDGTGVGVAGLAQLNAAAKRARGQKKIADRHFFRPPILNSRAILY